MDTKREARHANHQMRRGRTRDTSRDMRIKLKWIQSARKRPANHQTRRRNTRDSSRDMRLKLKWIQSARHDTRITRRDEETHETRAATCDYD